MKTIDLTHRGRIITVLINHIVTFQHFHSQQGVTTTTVILTDGRTLGVDDSYESVKERINAS